MLEVQAQINRIGLIWYSKKQGEKLRLLTQYAISGLESVLITRWCFVIVLEGAKGDYLKGDLMGNV